MSLVLRILPDGTRVAARVQGDKHVVAIVTVEELLSRLVTLSKKLCEAKILAYSALPESEAESFAKRLAAVEDVIDELGDELDSRL